MLIRRLSLRSKLIAAVLLPLAVVAAFSIRDILSARDTSELAARQQVEIRHQEAIAEFAEAVSDERGVLYAPDATDEALATERAKVDEAVEELRAPSLDLEPEALEGVEAIFADVLALRGMLGNQIAPIRAAVSSGQTTPVGASVEDFIDVPEAILDLAEHEVTDPAALENLTTVVLLQRTHETLAVEGILLQQAVAQPAITAQSRSRIELAIGASNEAIDAAIDLGKPSKSAEISAYIESPDWATYQSLRREVTALSDGQASNVDPDFLSAQRVAVFEEFESHELQIFSEMTTDAEDLASSSRFTLIRTLVLAGLLLAGVSALVFLLYRAIRSSLARVERRADEIATVELPEVVRLMRQEADLAEVPEIEAIPVDSDDEIGRLVEAFNGMQTTAIQLASEQAASRAIVANMFVNLGRRNQKLLMRMLGSLGDLERSEADPDRLAMLYDVDHLATRMRRNAESLLILAGAKASRVFDQPLSTAELVRSALSEVEGYDRVRINIVEDALINGDAVADLSHLLAELVENALKFSPPTDGVEVVARYTRMGYILAVTDQGLGMTVDEIIEANDRIATAATSGETPSKRLGLFVVGQLASRHGMVVELLEGVPAGLIVRIRIPKTMLASELPPGVIDPDHRSGPGGTASQATDQASEAVTRVPSAVLVPARPEYVHQERESSQLGGVPNGTQAPTLAPSGPETPPIPPLALPHRPPISRPAPPEVPVEQRSGPFNAPRRVAGENLPSTVSEEPKTFDDSDVASSDPATVASNLSGFQQGVSQASRRPNGGGSS